jgi:hypothetical protein
MAIIRQPIHKYHSHRRGAEKRGIDFLFSFDEWWDMWQNSGHWEERGTKNGQYVMARKGDVGPYSVSNVDIILASQNISDAHKGKSVSLGTRQLISNSSSGRIWTEENKQKLRGPRQPLGYKRKSMNSEEVSCPHCGKSGAKRLMTRYHFNNCKLKGEIQ